MMKLKLGALAAAAALTALAGNASAGTTTFNLYDGFGSNVGSGDGNVRTFNSDGVTLNATAWSYETSGSFYEMEAANLGQWSAGLGVQYSHSDSHTVDNQSQIDFIYLSFSEAVNLTSAYFTAWANDSDAVAYFRTLGSAGPTDGGNFNTFDNNWSSLISLAGNGSNGSRNLGVSDYSTGWIIGAAPGSWPHYDRDDQFKLKSITVQTAAVPEPATWAMMLMGFFGLGSVVRRKKRASQLAAA